MTATASPARCTLADLPGQPGRFVTFQARITTITKNHEATADEWATITLTDGRELVDVRVYPTIWGLCSFHAVAGAEVVVSADVVQGCDGVFLAADTIHPAVTR